MKMRAKNIISVMAFFFVCTIATGQIKPGSTYIPEPDTLDGQKVFQVVDKMPEYPGGTEKMYRFLAKNIKISDDKIKTIGIKIMITFVIDTTGRVKNECIVKSNTALATADASAVLAVIKRLDKWLLGEQKGEKVPVRYSIPIIMDFK